MAASPARLDRGSSSQLAFDDAEHAALLSRDEDSAWILRIVSAVPLVDIGALDLALGEFLGLVDDVAQGVPVVRVAGQRLGMQHELTARARALVVTMETLTPNS